MYRCCSCGGDCVIVGLHYFSIVDCMRKGSQLAIFAKRVLRGARWLPWLIQL